MSRDQPTSSELGVTRQVQIDAVCVRFEKQWREGHRPQIEITLRDYEEPLRSHLLRCLLQLELEYRDGQGEEFQTKDYLDRFPQDQALVHIVCDEHAHKLSLNETEPAGKPQLAIPQSESKTSQSDSSLHGRFIPGTKLAGRYRIVSLLGKGGMGEVYRADDLRLGQTVALKFLPRKLAQDQNRLDRFQTEVRLTRQISHPNVCRVYDLDEVNGDWFLSMEFIDGEDLRILLRRIGRLPKDKGVQIAQQLCAGLNAAHEKGVLHRDLKPANIMIDGRGHVRITDFGLAKLAAENQAEIAGTPAYMAPEQLRRGQTTIQSDLYSLGLILYELFTGEAVNRSANIAELLQSQEESSPSEPSSLVDDMDPVVERVILRCLAKEPHERPESARAVTASLPGGDPLAAALAAGETPSPEMVAAAGGVGELDPRIASGLLAAVVIGLLVTWLMSGRTNPISGIDLKKHPQALASDARDIIKAFGYDDKPKDSAWRYSTDVDYVRHVKDTNQPPDRTGQPSPLVFWYRQSPVLLQSQSFYTEEGKLNLGYVGFNDPPLSIPGMVSVRLDPRGRLVEFRAIPTQTDTSTTDLVSQPDWLKLFGGNHQKVLGFDLQSFRETDSTSVASTAYDNRVAWEGEYSNGTPIRVEAASLRGKPVHFQLVGAWTRSESDRRAERKRVTDFRMVLVAALLISAGLAIYNIRVGRGDRRGATRLALFAFSVGMLIYLLAADHLQSISELQLFHRAMAWSVCWAASTWLSYVAIEPFVRRIWPGVLISWSRVLTGRLRDPLVGRHLLVGVLAGILVQSMESAATLAAVWMGPPLSMFSPSDLVTIQGTNWFLCRLLAELSNSVDFGLFSACLLLILKVIFRKNSLTALAFVVIFSVLLFPRLGEPIVAGMVMLSIVFSAFVTVLMRFGLLPFVVAGFVSQVLDWPMTTDTSAWYFGTGAGVLAIVFAMAAYGCYTSLGNKPVVRGS